MNNIGTIIGEASLKGTLTAAGTISGEISTEAMSLTGTLSTESKDIPSYTGEYEVTPKAYDDQVLETQNKLMNDNITVFKVPRYDTSNLGGGLTVFIAEE